MDKNSFRFLFLSKKRATVISSSCQNLFGQIKATTATVAHTQNTKTTTIYNQTDLRMVSYIMEQQGFKFPSSIITSPPLLSVLSCILFLTPHHSPEHSLQIHLSSPRGLWEQVFTPWGVLFCMCACVSVCVYLSVCTCVHACCSHHPTEVWSLSSLCLSRPGGSQPSAKMRYHYEFIRSDIWWTNSGAVMH